MKMSRLGVKKRRRRPAPVSSPVSKEVQTPVSSPVSQEVQTPVSSPVSKEVQTPVSSPVSKEVQAPVSSPVSQDGVAPVSQRSRHREREWWYINLENCAPSGIRYQGELRQYCIEQMIRGKCSRLVIESGVKIHRDRKGKLIGNYQQMYCALPLPLESDSAGLETDMVEVRKYIPVDGRQEECFKQLRF